MYKLLNQHCQQPLQLSASSSPLQPAFSVYQTVAGASSNVLWDLCNNKKRLHKLNITSRKLFSSLDYKDKNNVTQRISRKLFSSSWLYRWEQCKPAAWYVAFRLFACSSMELQEIPHFLTKDTTSRRTCFALYTMSEKPLHLTAIRILAVWRTTLWCMNQKIKHFSKLKWEIPITLEWTLKEARLPILRNHYLKLKKSCTCYLFNYLFGKGKRGRKYLCNTYHAHVMYIMKISTKKTCAL